MEGGGATALLLDTLVLGSHREAVGDLLRQEIRVAGIVHHNLPQHLAYDHLDVLVVDVHALRPVDFLHLVDQVTLGLSGTAVVTQVVLQNLVRVDGALRYRGVGPDLGPLNELRPEELALDLVLPALRDVGRGDDNLYVTVALYFLKDEVAIYIG